MTADFTPHGGEVEPPHCLRVIFRHALALVVLETQLGLSTGITLLSREAIPPHGLGIVFLDTVAIIVFLITYGVPWKGTVPQRVRIPPRQTGVNGYVRPRIFGEQDLVRMGGPASAVAVSTQEIFFEDRR